MKSQTIDHLQIGTPLTSSSIKVMMLGSGELGKEVVIEFQRYGVEVIAVDRYPDAPAMQVAHRSYSISMLDAVALRGDFDNPFRDDLPDRRFDTERPKRTTSPVVCLSHCRNCFVVEVAGLSTNDHDHLPMRGGSTALSLSHRGPKLFRR